MVSFADITLEKNVWTDLTAVTGVGVGVALIVSNPSTGGGTVVRVEDATVEPPTDPIRNGPALLEGQQLKSSPVAGDSVFATSLLGETRVSVQVAP